MQRTFFCYACRTTRFIGAVAATLTSRRAMRLYRAIGHYTVRCLQGATALLLVLGAACFALGWLTRYGISRHAQAVAALVADCQVSPVQPVLALAPAAAPIALLPPAPEPLTLRVLVTPAPAEDRVLVTPAPVVTKPRRKRKEVAAQPVAEIAPKGKRGRPRKQAIA